MTRVGSWSVVCVGGQRLMTYSDKFCRSDCLIDSVSFRIEIKVLFVVFVVCVCVDVMQHSSQFDLNFCVVL